MNSVYSALSRTLKLASLALLIGFVALPAVAQETKTVIKEGQEYKMKYNEALEAAKAKDYNKAYTAFGEAATLAEAAGESDVAAKANKVMAQIDNSRGTRAFKQENYEEALQFHQTGIELSNGYVPNHYGKAKALQKMDRMEEALPIFQAVMGMGDRKSASAAERSVRGHFVYIASTQLSSNNSAPSQGNAQAALDALEEMELYVEADADVLYYRAEAYKTLGDYAKSIEMADKALEVHRGSRADKAKIYFVKGEAHMFAGSNQAASDAFSNALFGSYKPLAEHYLNELNSSGE